MHETQALAQFVADTHFTDLSPELIEDCRIAVLDSIAAAVVGTAQPWAQRVLDLVQELSSGGDSTVINQPWHTDVSRAALANGTLIGAFECEPLTGSHASGTVLPAVLAVSERLRLDGSHLLLAVALGFEVSARIARTAVGLESVRGFHNPGTQGPLAAAVAVGKLYNFDAQQLVSALGLAGSCSAGLLEFAWTGADTKRLHLGRASQLGLESALLAGKGLQGPATVLEGQYGYYNAFSEPTDLNQLIDGLGTQWAIQPASLKSYATHVTHQSVVQALQDWKQDTGLAPEQLTHVSIEGAPRIMEPRHSVRDPTTVMGGQYSLPFTTAIALTRDMANPLVYNATAIQDPLVRKLAQQIELQPDESVLSGHGVFPSTLHLKTTSTTYALTTQPHKGSPSNPFTWDEICEKFHRYTHNLLNPDQQAAIISSVSHLDQLRDITELTHLLSAR